MKEQIEKLIAKVQEALAVRKLTDGQVESLSMLLRDLIRAKQDVEGL